MLLSKLTVLKHSQVVKKLIKRSFSPGVYCDWVPEDQRPMTVAIIGGHTGEGVLTAFLLKQSKLIDEVRLYSGLISPCGDAYDVSHIDTNAQIKAYTGQKFLKDVVTDAQIVLVCGGHPKKPCTTPEELFESNADYVRNIALYMGEFNPRGIICISTPPVTALVPMVAEVMKKENVYDPRKILGIMTLGSIRATSIVAMYTNKNPSDVVVPVIGGMCRNTLVPVFSQIRPKITIDAKLLRLLQEKIATAEDEALDLKYIENTGSCHVSSAFATARFTTSVVKGLRGEPNIIECGFVRQLGHIRQFLPYMGSIIKLGFEGIEQSSIPPLNKSEVERLYRAHPHIAKHALMGIEGRNGVDSYFMPTINDEECKHLQCAYPFIKSQIQMGETFVVGARRVSRLNSRSSRQCEVIKKKPVTMVGDVQVNVDEMDIDKDERCIQIIR